MLTLDLDALIERTLETEGGWADHPEDTGGPTNWGITLPKFRDYQGAPDAQVSELKALTRDGARAIYRWIFQNEMGLGSIGAAADPKVQGLIYDCVVNHGPRGATELLQLAVGVKADGLIGPKTRAALAAADPRALFRKVLAERCRKYGRIISHDPTQATFAAGWADRVADFIEEAP